jgi:histidine ammonia-lyase
MAFRKPSKTSPYLEEMVNTFRSVVPFIEEDRVLHDDMKNAEKFIREFRLE